MNECQNISEQVRFICMLWLSSVQKFTISLLLTEFLTVELIYMIEYHKVEESNFVDFELIGHFYMIIPFNDQQVMERTFWL